MTDPITPEQIEEGDALLRGGESDARSLVEFNRWAIRHGDQLLSAARRSLEYEAFFRKHGKAAYECLLSRALGLSDASVASSAHSAAASLHAITERLK